MHRGRLFREREGEIFLRNTIAQKTGLLCLKDNLDNNTCCIV